MEGTAADSASLVQGPYASILHSLLSEADVEASWLTYTSEQWHPFLQSKYGPMSESHKTSFTNEYPKLVNTVVISDVIDHLMSDAIVSDEQRQRFKRCKSRQDGVRELLSVIQSAGEAGYCSFCHALSDPFCTKRCDGEGNLQDHFASLADDLLGADNEVSFHTFTATQWQSFLAEVTGPLTDKHRCMLNQKRVHLVRILVVDDIIGRMTTDGVVGDEQKQLLDKEMTQQEKVRELLSIVESRGEKGYYSLGHALLHPESSSSNYRIRLIKFHQDRTLRQAVHAQSNYIPTMLFVGKDELKAQKTRTHFQEFVPSQSRKVGQPIKQSQLFQQCSELEEKTDPRSVLLIGVPGVGKTSFCYRMLQNIINNEQEMNSGLTKPFFIKFRETNIIEGKTTFREFLFDHCGPTVESEDQNKVWKYLMEHEEDVVFLLDGLDECEGIGVNFQETYTVELSAVDKKAEPSVLLVNLMRGNIMSKSKVLTTSRPFCAHRIKSLVQRIVELQCLDKKQMKQLMKSILGPELRDLQKSFKKYLADHPYIAGLCCVPRQAKCLIEYVKEAHTVQGKTVFSTEEMPETMAGLLFLVMLHMLKESDRDTDRYAYQDEVSILANKAQSLVKLTKLAFEGLFSTNGVKQLFTESDIKAHGLTTEELGRGIMNSYEIARKTFMSRKTSCLVHSFPHLTVQEFLASLRLLQMPVDDLKELILQHRGEHQMTWLMYFGASGDRTISELVHRVYPGMKAQEYRQKAKAVLRALLDSARDVDSVTKLYLIHVLSESQQLDLADHLTPALVDWAGILEMPQTSPADHLAVAKYLGSVKHQAINIITISSYTDATGVSAMLTGPAEHGFNGLCVWGNLSRELVDVVRKMTSTHASLHYLHFGSSPQSTIDQTSCFVSASNTNITHLTLSTRNISPAWLHDNLQCLLSLEAFTLTSCRMLDWKPWGPVLEQLLCLHNLQYLILRHCSLDGEAMQVVSKLIASLPLTWLDLSMNDDLGDAGLECLAHCLQDESCNLTALNVLGCGNTSSEGQRVLCESLRRYRHIKILGIDAVGLDHVSKMLETNTQIEELTLTFTYDTRRVPDCRLCLPSKPSSIHDECFDISDLGLCPLRGTSLAYLECSDISDNDVQSLTKELQNSTTLHCLKLKSRYSTNVFLSTEVIKELIGSSNLEALDLCHIELDKADGWQQVAHAVCNNSSLQTLGIPNTNCFLQVLVDHYPKDGPLRAIHCWYPATNEARSLAQSLKDKLAPHTLQVYYDVEDMALQAGYKWRSVPQDTRTRLYCDKHHY